MPEDTSAEGPVAHLPDIAAPIEPLDDAADAPSVAPAWVTGLMTLVAAAAILANCLLTCPSRFSERQLRDTSALQPIIHILSLGSRCPTIRGVEVRDLAFYGGAAVLTFLAGLGLLSARRRALLTMDDLFDVRSRARGPVFWWIILLVVSALSSFYSHASEVCQGQTMIRLLAFAWWWPLAGLLSAAEARRLCWALMAALGLTAAIGLWYHVARVLPELPEARLQYPLGNELWLAACLLPALLIAAGPLTQFILRTTSGSGAETDEAEPPSYLRAALLTLVLLLVGGALVLTRSRSAAAGLAVGLVVFAGMAAMRPARRGIALCGLVAAIAAACWVQYLRTHGEMGQRAHSIRSRLNHEWPYAVNLLLQKPVAGHGDGAYALLAGQFARVDQLDDPSTMRSDESSWTAHAHNEFLELLADLGVVGAGAFIAALLLTLFHALRYCDARRESGTADRWLVIGLASALVAMAVEQCADSALREPGLAAIFYSIWAILWAMIRGSRSRPSGAVDSSRLAPSTLRLGGLAVVGLSLILGRQAIGNWQGIRARFEADRSLNAQAYGSAIQQADFASAHILDPFQRSLARLTAVWARALAFDAALAANPGAPGAADMQLSQQALSLLARLNFDTPRFLRVSRLAAELYLNRSRAFERSGDGSSRQEADKKFLDALIASRADEPFLIDRAVALWRSKPDARSVDRIYWLRSLIRAGEMDEQVTALFASLPRYPDFRQALEATFAFAQEESTRPPSQWKDRLVPETFRLAALARLLAGDPTEAEKLAARAEELYTAAGPRLFAAHAASLHEMVRYSMARDITADTDKNLARLARAQTILAPPTDAATPLRGSLGRTRLALLLAAGREEDARRQAELLRSTEGIALDRALAHGCLEAAQICLGNPAQVMRAVAFAEKAAALQPDLADAQASLTAACLQSGRDDAALAAARRFIKLVERPEAAIGYLKRLRAGTPSSRIWADLEREYPQLRPATTGPANAGTATAPARSPP